MTEAFASTRQRPDLGAIRVAPPRIGDVMSGALHMAYDGQGAMPEDLAFLLGRLDRIEHRPG